MKLRNLWVVVALLSSASYSGSPTGGPGGVTSQPVPVPGATAPGSLAPASRQPASWQSVEQAKVQYNVFRSYAPPDLAARFDRPVTDAAQRALIARRAAAFRSGARSLRLAVNPNAIIDVGATRPEDANTVAIVDLEKSADLQALLRPGPNADPASLKVDEQKNFVLTTLATSIARDAGAAPAYESYDNLTVTVAARDLSRVSAWTLVSGQWQRMFDVTAASVDTRDPQVLLNRTQLRRDRYYFEGLGAVTRAQTATSQSIIRSGSVNQFEAMLSRLQSGYSTADRDKAAEEKAKAAEAAQTEAQKAAEANPKLTAYGKIAPCTRYCSAQTCRNCCTSHNVAAINGIAGVAFACHFFSDFCPWCHAGCAANTTAMMLVAENVYASCRSGCNQATEVQANQGNPRNCPVH